MALHNPWRGLASYKDPTKSEYKYSFCGRDSEIIELGNLIRNNLFVTLYGRTGVGKTSLLNAGVFPILREYDYYPLYIRLSQTPADITYSEAIIREIEKSGLDIETIIETNDNSSDSKTFLWSYFCTRKFIDKTTGKIVYPVIVLDQFEEIFFAEKRNSETQNNTLSKAELLLSQISVLLTDDLALPEGYSNETNYRFVASIREDNLFYLEDCIDNLSLSIYKGNRFRLRPLNDKNAQKVILTPGTDYIDTNHTNDIVDRIIHIAQDKDGTISSLLLSFICSLLYEDAAKQNPAQPIITLQQIPSTDEDTDKILCNFYLKCTTKPQRRAIEEHLLTEDGHRKSTMQKQIPNAEELLTGSNRILQKIETDKGEQIEIIHDRLAEVIYKQRTYHDNYKFRNLLRVLLLLFLGVCTICAINFAMGSSNGPVSISPIATDLSPAGSTSISLHQSIDATRIYYSSSIRNVFIGENVDSIERPQERWKEGLNVSISHKNKKYKWDSIYSYNAFSGEYIGYLYQVDDPQKILYIQDNPPKKVRLPKGINSLYLNEEEITNHPNVPYWGEEEFTIKSEDEFFFENDNKIKRISLQGISNIPSKSFFHCKNLEYINIDSITSIGISAFEGCEKLQEINLLSDEVKVNHDAFKGCINLKSVRLPKRLKGNVENLFAYCYNLKSIVLPDVIEDTSGLYSMFRCCPNIKDIQFHSNNTRFKFGKDSVLYYETIPVIFSTSKTKFDHVNKPYLCLTDGLLSVKILDNPIQTIYLHPDIIQEQWQRYHGNPFGIIGYNNHIRYFSNDSIVDYKRTIEKECFVIRHNNEEALYLPPQGNKYNIYGSQYGISEIHTPVGDPDRFSININGSELSPNGIVLYVPYGTIKEYMNHEDFKEFKDIKEDSLWKRIHDILYLYGYNMIIFFDARQWLYLVAILGLCVLFFIIYRVRLYQMKNNGRIIKKQALKDSLICMPIAIIGFVPVYYMCYIYITNHMNYDINLNFLGIILGTIFGCISAIVSSYLFVYMGKGRIKLLTPLKRALSFIKK